MKWVQLAEFTKFVSPVRHDPQNLVRYLQRTDTRFVFCNRKLMRTNILFTTTTFKPISYAISWTLNYRKLSKYMYIKVMKIISAFNMVGLWVFNYIPLSTTCHNISVTLLLSVLWIEVEKPASQTDNKFTVVTNSNWSTLRKPLTSRKSLTNFII